jgi:hypothetical protein
MHMIQNKNTENVLRRSKREVSAKAAPWGRLRALRWRPLAETRPWRVDRQEMTPHLRTRWQRRDFAGTPTHAQVPRSRAVCGDCCRSGMTIMPRNCAVEHASVPVGGQHSSTHADATVRRRSWPRPFQWWPPQFHTHGDDPNHRLPRFARRRGVVGSASAQQLPDPQAIAPRRVN